MFVTAGDCWSLLVIVGLIQLIVTVSILATEALKEVSAAERFRWGNGQTASMPDSDPRPLGLPHKILL